MTFTRRKFLQTLAVSASAVALTQLTGCMRDDTTASTEEGARELARLRSQFFPQSVMSGDPRVSSVVLWTRLGGVATAGSVTLQVARDAAFTQVVVDQTFTVSADYDHCLKVRVTQLTADKYYYYRFIYQGLASNTGRTRTAPAEETDRKVRFAFVSCQDYIGRYYNVYLRLLTPDMDDLDFVVHLGDYVYETSGDPEFQTPSEQRKLIFTDEAGAVALSNGQGDAYYAAGSLDNYRQLYRTYRSDVTLQKVHEKFPLVAIWDDHEFSDDCWQNNATYTDGARGEGDITRKRNAEQAYFEFMPIDQESVAGAQTTAAGRIGIDPALLSTGSVDAASGVGNLSDGVSIYRSLRFGKHLDLFLTDFRTHRADHLIPEDAFPGEIVVTQDTLQAVVPPASPVSAYAALQFSGAFANDGNDAFTYLHLAAPAAGLETLFVAVLTGNGSADPAVNALLGATFQGYLSALVSQGLETNAAQARALVLARQGLSGGVLVRVVNALLTGIYASTNGPATIAALNAALTGNSSPYTLLINTTTKTVSLPPELTGTLPKGLGYATLGKSGFCSDLGSRYFVIKPIYDLYAAISAAAGRSQDMWGSGQFNWLSQGLGRSTATWRVLGTSVSFTPMVLGLRSVLSSEAKALLPADLNNDFYLNVDQWDGYPVYRDSTVMPLLKPTLASPNGVVSIAGDIHSTWVSDHGEGRMCFTTGSISSETFYGMLVGQVDSLADSLTAGDAERKVALSRQAGALLALADSIVEQSDVKARLGRTDEHGLGVVAVDGVAMEISFHQLKPKVAGLDMIGTSWYDMPKVVLDAMFERRYRVENNQLYPLL